jgi:hypothetical protein
VGFNRSAYPKAFHFPAMQVVGDDRPLALPGLRMSAPDGHGRPSPLPGRNTLMTQPDFVEAVESELHLRGIPFDRAALLAFVASRPRRTGMVLRGVRQTGRGTSRSKPSRRWIGPPACQPLRISPDSCGHGDAAGVFSTSGEPGGGPDTEVNAHLGNSG